MKALGIGQKVKAIKLFLSGETYDEISQQTGIAKGSVVNIIDQFKAGEIPVVDMKKLGATVGQLKGYSKLHAKLDKMAKCWIAWIVK